MVLSCLFGTNVVLIVVELVYLFIFFVSWFLIKYCYLFFLLLLLLFIIIFLVLCEMCGLVFDFFGMVLTGFSFEGKSCVFGGFDCDGGVLVS